MWDGMGSMGWHGIDDGMGSTMARDGIGWDRRCHGIDDAMGWDGINDAIES